MGHKPATVGAGLGATSTSNGRAVDMEVAMWGVHGGTRS